jgi:hypothetical protein
MTQIFLHVNSDLSRAVKTSFVMEERSGADCLHKKRSAARYGKPNALRAPRKEDEHEA